MLLALSSKCHFCSESAPFYQRLNDEMAQHTGARLIAVFPQEVGEGKQYLSALGVKIEDVRNATLNSIGVNGTPTLIIIDSKGRIEQSWVGKLSPEKEAEVISRVKTSA